MFPFVIQMGEVVMERELKLRQALQAMGLHDTAYWLSWHLYQSFMALLFGFFIWVFGMIFQLRMFRLNGVPRVHSEPIYHAPLAPFPRKLAPFPRKLIFHVWRISG